MDPTSPDSTVLSHTYDYGTTCWSTLTAPKVTLFVPILSLRRLQVRWHVLALGAREAPGDHNTDVPGRRERWDCASMGDDLPIRSLCQHSW